MPMLTVQHFKTVTMKSKYTIQKSKYTIQERHEIYKNALTIFSKRRRKWVGLCCTLDEAACSINFIHEDFPEVELFRNAPYAFWWPERDRLSRITCLLFCIEMTKP